MKTLFLLRNVGNSQSCMITNKSMMVMKAANAQRKVSVVPSTPPITLSQKLSGSVVTTTITTTVRLSSGTQVR